MLPDFLLQILNNHGDDLQQLALLSYLKSEDKGRPFLEAVTAAKVCYGFYKKFSKEDEIEAARTETILRIAQYVKTHPHARPHELRAKVDDEINLFRVKLQSIQ